MSRLDTVPFWSREGHAKVTGWVRDGDGDGTATGRSRKSYENADSAVIFINNLLIEKSIPN